jgi:hypothetical protein
MIARLRDRAPMSSTSEATAQRSYSPIRATTTVAKHRVVGSQDRREALLSKTAKRNTARPGAIVT